MSAGLDARTVHTAAGLQYEQVAAHGGIPHLELRLEVYNVTNTANFLPPGGSFGSTDFGVISQQGNYIPRQMQFAMKYLF